MSTPSQGLRALAAMIETVAPQLTTDAHAALDEVAQRVHQAADAEAAAEAAKLAGPVAAPMVSAFANAMIDAFFTSLRLGQSPSSASA